MAVGVFGNCGVCCAWRGLSSIRLHAPSSRGFPSPASHTFKLVWNNWQSIQVCWYAARKGKRQAKQQAQRKAKVEKMVKEEVYMPYHIRRAEKDAAKKKRRAMKETLRDNPIDDVYLTKYYKPRVYSVLDAIQMHKETHHPTICNEPNAILKATVELNMQLSTKKKRYLDNFHGTLCYPHQFDMNLNKKVIALCKDKLDQAKALDAGAFLAGGPELIKQIYAKELKADEFDHLVVHPDILSELVTIRGLLRKHFPTKSKGNLGTDMPYLVQHFLKGIDYHSVKDKYEQNTGWVDIPIGRLDMVTEVLEKNAVTMLNTIHSQSAGYAMSSQFISRAALWSLPSEERFAISYWNHIEGYNEPGAEETKTDEDFDEESLEAVSNLKG